MPIAAPDSYPGTPGTTLYAGMASPPSGELRLITSTQIRSTSGSAQTGVPTTFGQPFRQGDFNPSTESLYAKVDGADVTLQTDAISTFGDGSARLAVLSTQLASLPGGGSKTVEIYAGPKVTPGSGSFNADTWNPVVTLTISGVTWTVSPRTQLLSQIASNTGVRLNGPVAKEVRVMLPFKDGSNNDHPHLRLCLDVRIYANGSIFADYIFENGSLLAASPANYAYSVSVTNGPGGATIFTQASFTHYSRARWHKPVWHGTQPQFRPIHNKAYFLDSRITWNFNRSLTVASAALNTIQSNLSMGGSGPMAYGGLTVDMPGTGGRDEIAPVPKWTVMWLLSQDDRAWTAMMGNADGAATAPVHFRDLTSGLPVDVASRPSIAVRFGTSSPSVPATPAGSPWTPDIAHQGSYFFIPYVVTGNHFYLEEMTFWASWNVAAVDPSGRGAASGYLAPVEQLRGLAWGLRSLLECCYALPDGHPQKSYFTTIKNNNVSFLNSNYTSTSDNNYVFPLGGCKGIYNNNQIPGYENDFFMYVLSWGIENGESGLAAARNNVARYIVGRFTAEVQAQGFCTANAAHYWFNSRTGSTPYTTWSAYATANSAGGTCGTVAKAGDPAYPEWAEGYAAVARGMLGAAANSGHTDAPAAYARWLTFTPSLAADFVNSPQYDVVLRA